MKEKPAENDDRKKERFKKLTADEVVNEIINTFKNNVYLP